VVVRGCLVRGVSARAAALSMPCVNSMNGIATHLTRNRKPKRYQAAFNRGRVRPRDRGSPGLDAHRRGDGEGSRDLVNHLHKCRIVECRFYEDLELVRVVNDEGDNLIVVQ
jgi:hypothetical protein